MLPQYKGQAYEYPGEGVHHCTKQSDVFQAYKYVQKVHLEGQDYQSVPSSSSL
jgi:hypothetical protein